MRATSAAYDALEAVSASATRAGDVREWEHVRFLGRGDAAIEAECDRRIAALTAPPPALAPELVAALCAFPDPALVAWLAADAARGALSDRERTHLGRLADQHGTTIAASEIRDRLRSGGDYEVQRQRAQLAPGARVQVDRRYYTVVTRGERNVHLTGERGGHLTICAPEVERASWYAWVGGLARKGARLVTLRRLDAGHFVSVAGSS